ncbi:hypothetical protein F4820DRAFT_241540 [Hypoxylon rubiginosum]|uniref:Uncharacterized protein n=1 Tax=Hypoxylon rubiginosum TaxID=110542 RepID=A0ACB9Z5J0_9PEZI|nr:hypothetical protein F4820DRAFT_241540 [Hypoxylon rubiginosum]
MAGPAVKQQRRKVSTLKKSKVTTPQRHASSSISSFARVSKTTTHVDIKKELATTPIKNATLEPLTPASRKRKVVASVEDDDLSADETPKKLSLPLAKSGKAVAQPAKRGRGRPPKKSRPEPASKKRARSPSVSDSDESTVNAGTLFKKLRLESSPSRCSSPLTAETSLTDYSEADADNEITPTKKTQRPLPSEVLDLIDLHSALLKTLTLHYAHNGSNVPADLRVLCPNVARAWGKKRVTDADIRICLGVLNQASTSQHNNGNKTSTQTKVSPLFSLSNYGRGKVCIEIDSAQHSGGRPLDEKKLNGEFRSNLTLLWTQFATATENGAADASSTFVSTLPKAPVSLCASLAKAAPVLSKGQKRLEELKHGIMAKKEATAAAVAKKPQTSNSSSRATNGNDTPMTNADGSKMSLLDRIRLKSLQRASSSATNLTPAQLERRAALQRASEVAAVLGMLGRAGGDGGRVPFTMATVLEKLKDSFREGISREEGAACVRLLAADVAPEWIRVVVVGGRENVVVETDRQMGRADIEGRVRAILGREGVRE